MKRGDDRSTARACDEPGLTAVVDPYEDASSDV